MKRQLTSLLPILAFCQFGLAADLPPYTLRPEIDIPLIGLGAAMKFHSGGALKEARGQGVDLEALDRTDLLPFDRWAAGNYSPMLSSLSGGISFAESLVPLAIGGWDIYRKNQGWLGLATDFILLQEALAISSSLVSYSKSMRFHPTPLTYGSSASSAEKAAPHNVSSFFSGHTTAAFTTAVFTGYTFQLKHPDSPLVPWVWGGMLGAATGVGALRVAAGKHFPSDVLAGAAVGSLCGYLIPRLHLRNASRKESQDRFRHGNAGRRKHVEWGLGISSVSGSSLPVPTLSLKF